MEFTKPICRLIFVSDHTARWTRGHLEAMRAIRGWLSEALSLLPNDFRCICRERPIIGDNWNAFGD